MAKFPRLCLSQLLEAYPNLGPIVDFCVMDLDRQGQGQVSSHSFPCNLAVCLSCHRKGLCVTMGNNV
jgi:hypothetical protein